MQVSSKGGQRGGWVAGAPLPIVWLLVASLSAVTVLFVAHSTLGLGGGDADGGRARHLLQRGRGGAAGPAHGAAALHGPRDPEVQRLLQARLAEQQQVLATGGAGEHGAGALQAERRGREEEDEAGARQQGGGPSSSGSSGGGSPSGELLDGLSPGGSGGVEWLSASADLATFAAPGTQCVVTPSHGKVALLFLTHGDLPHDALWTDWMRAAGGLLPRASLAAPDAFCLQQCDDAGPCERRCGAAAACNPLCLDALAGLGRGRSAAVLSQQHLFSVYVHARPTLKDYPDGSIFQGRLIPDRIMAKWASHALAAAAKKLVEAAVLDQRNQRFVLVGDTTVPLHHPALMWRQLMHENGSRVDACWHQNNVVMGRRYNPTAMKGTRFDPTKHWRKSSQWFTLNRKHADLLAADREVESIFSKHCSVGWDEQLKKHRDCISDEHYLPSLLAMHELANETNCDFTGGTYARWGASGSHPMLFQPGHVSAALLEEIRRAPGHSLDAPATEADKASCARWPAAMAAARASFVEVGGLMADTCASTLASPERLLEDSYAGAALSDHCVLLARKFSKPASKWVHGLLRSCDPGVGVLPCDQNSTTADREWW